MKTLIIFREGHGGHFLKALINNKPVEAKFRMDPWYPRIYNEPLKDFDYGNCVCLHQSPGSDYEKKFDLVLTILPSQKIYHAIYNIFFKKVLIEQFTNKEYQDWRNNLLFWYDKTYYNIRDYVDRINQDTSNNRYSNVIDFDQIINEEYISKVFQQYFNVDLSDTQKTLIQQYKDKQLNIQLTIDGKSMSEIVDPIPDNYFVETPWFASYCIYKFERNNGLSESQRLWSINTVTSIIDKKFLLNLENQYH
jgi:hypothetical protein